MPEKSLASSAGRSRDGEKGKSRDSGPRARNYMEKGVQLLSVEKFAYTSVLYIVSCIHYSDALSSTLGRKCVCAYV